MTSVPDFWVIVPAAGSARRMGQDVPKQYLQLAGRAVIEWSLRPFLALRECRGVIVVLAADDRHWMELALAREPKVSTATGGTQRADSVRAGLDALSEASESDWVLVHDAARPCVDQREVIELLRTLRDDAVGGLLAAPVVDTLKRASADQRVSATVDRGNLWRALTPQMFRFGVLKRALDSNNGATDESQAVEALGLSPRLVAGSSENIKVTLPHDLARAERILKSRGLQ